MKTYILGNGGFAQELFESVFIANSQHTFSGFIILQNDKAFVISEHGLEPFTNDKDAAFIVGTQNLIWRSKFISYFTELYDVNKKHFPNIHSKAHVSKTAILGVGNVFAPFSSVNGIAQVGNFNSFSTYSSINNRSKIGNNNILGSYAGIMNKCCIGDNNVFQPNSIITEQITVGNYNMISAGECVFDDISDQQLFQSGIIMKKPNKGK